MNALEIILKIRGRFEDIIMRSLAPKVKNVDYVYHYTSIESLLNINNTNELWLSHVSYMNDPLEIKFGINTIINILEKQKTFKYVPQIIKNNLQTSEQYSLDLKLDLAFVFSVTELRDNKPFWLQYGNQGKGVSIQFKNHEILKTLSKYISMINMYFPVQYYSNDYLQSDDNITEFEECIIEYYKYIESSFDEKELEDINVQREIFGMSKLLSCFVKNDFYKQEKEWRFAVFAGMGNENVKVISKDDNARMIYTLCMKNNDLFNLIENIQIGPVHNKDTKVTSALELAIYKKQNMFYNIEFSKGVIK